MPETPFILVVAAALVNGHGNILVQRRPPGKSMAGLWEFPGGKIEPGERPQQALVRELFEELGIIVVENDLVAGPFVSEPSGDSHLLLMLFICREWQGVPEPRHATELAWHAVTALHGLSMPPADLPLIDKLKVLLDSSPSLR